MAKVKKKRWFIPGFFIFIIYLFVVPFRIPRETVLDYRWIRSLETESSDRPVFGEELVPFTLGYRFGYVGSSGRFAINRIRNGNLSMSENLWSEYEPLPFDIEFMNPLNEIVLSIEQPGGYPFFLDNRIFLLSSEQISISELNLNGEVLWSYDFSGPITCVDASNGYFLAGTLDGALILLDRFGIPFFTPFEPGGSSMPIILGCTISEDASMLALIAGINEQRFLLMERSGDIFRVIYHEFLGAGFRRPVHINFVDNDSKVVFEREGGLGIFDISINRSVNIGLEGEIVALDNLGADGFLFLLTSRAENQKQLVTIRYPGLVVGQAPFYSENAFLTRRGSRLYLGGDSLLAMFELEIK